MRHDHRHQLAIGGGNHLRVRNGKMHIGYIVEGGRVRDCIAHDRTNIRESGILQIAYPAHVRERVYHYFDTYAP